MPKYSNVKPDFQAPGPRVLIEKEIKMEDMEQDDADDDFDESPFDTPKIRYYESKKILGKLYRAIDEHKFFKEIQRQSGSIDGPRNQTQSLINKVWQYVQEATVLIEWKHYNEFARNVRDASVLTSGFSIFITGNIADLSVTVMRKISLTPCSPTPPTHPIISPKSKSSLAPSSARTAPNRSVSANSP